MQHPGIARSKYCQGTQGNITGNLTVDIAIIHTSRTCCIVRCMLPMYVLSSKYYYVVHCRLCGTRIPNLGARAIYLPVLSTVPQPHSRTLTHTACPPQPALTDTCVYTVKVELRLPASCSTVW